MQQTIQDCTVGCFPETICYCTKTALLPFFPEKAEQVKQKSPGSAPASTYLSQAKSACNYTHTATRKEEFIEFTVTLQMCPAGGRSYS